MRAITKYEGEHVTHRILWTCCQHQLDMARSAERGRSHFDLAAMAMAYFTFESYLNYVGIRLCPTEWAAERSFFLQHPYRGTSGKLKLLLERTGGENIDLESKPFRAIAELRALRDYIAHGKPEKFAGHKEHARDESPPMFPFDRLGELVSKEIAERSISEVEEAIELLHRRFGAFVTDRWFGERALKGVLGYESTTTAVGP